ncbi:MAG: TonB-dependent receptor [Chitinophagaceae bacterium]|nr:TonB-dependent receptor [Chitinophagaceae bacterium]
MKKWQQSRALQRVSALLKIALLMKLAFIIILVTCLQVSANGYSQETKLTLDLKDVPISKALRTIERKTDYKFVYANNFFPADLTVTLQVKNAPVPEVLSKILDKTGFTFRKVDEDLIVITSTVQGSQITVTGTVTDINGSPLQGVTVALENSKVQTATNTQGEFSINAPENGVLVFSSVGFISERVPVNNRTVINITLTATAKGLDEVVVIGYGQRQKKDLTGAISTTSAKEIEKSSAASAELAMQGRMAGVFVSTPSGNPNDRVNVRIRGVNTFNGVNDPLYVIDGIPLTEGGLGRNEAVLQDLRTPINVFTIVDPNDIESISVLKDASAAAIYGVRAANGVILITTKRGKTGKPRIELNAYYGIQNSVSEGKAVLTPQQLVDLYKEAYGNNPKYNGGDIVPFGDPTAFGPEFDETSPKYLGNKPFIDWQKAYLNKNAPAANVSLKVSGANESLNYYISGSYYKTEGTLLGSRLDRYSLATNLSSKVSRIIEVGLTTRLVYEKNLNETSGDLSGAMTTLPWQPIYDPNGYAGYAQVYATEFEPNPDYDPNLVNSNPIKRFVDGYPYPLYGQQTRFNPFGFMAVNDNVYHQQRALGNGYIQITPFKGLRIKGLLAGDYFVTRNDSYNDFEAYRFNQTPGNPYGRDSNVVATLNTRNTYNISYTKELQATYATTIANNHQIEITGVANHQNWQWKILSGGGSLFSRDPNLRTTSQLPLLNTGGQQTLERRSLLGFVGRVSYKYSDRYYLDLSVRRDGSSRFAPNYRWGTFPSAAVAWRISSEKFFAPLTWINDLKLRANWGQVGNEQGTAGFAYLSIVNPGITVPNYSFGSGNGNPIGTQYFGAFLPNFANTTLSWETLTTSGIGFDATLFNNKINFTLEYYNKINKNIIQSVTPPPSTGIEYQPDINVASVRNSGIELQLGYTETIARDLTLSLSGNFTTVKNRVITLNGGIPFSDNVIEGYSMFFIRGYKMGGIFQSEAEVDAWRTKNTDVTAGQDPSDPAVKKPKPGDIYFEDVHGDPTAPGKWNNSPDGLVNSNDRTYLGKTIPGYFYGFNANLGWKGFDLSVFFQGVGDVQKYNWQRAGGESMSSNGVNQWATVLNRWTSQNPSTTIPRAVFEDPNVNNRESSRFVENAGFLRLKNIELGYTVPKTMLRKLGTLEGLRVSVSAINLATFTKWTGLDPENDVYPPAKQVLFRLSASF